MIQPKGEAEEATLNNLGEEEKQWRRQRTRHNFCNCNAEW